MAARPSESDTLLARRHARTNQPSADATAANGAPGPLASARSRALERFVIAESIGEPEVSVAVAPRLRDVGGIQFPDGVEFSERYKQWCIENRYSPGQTKLIPLDRVAVSPYNPRHFYDPTSIRELSTSIVQSGQQLPIIVVPDYATPGRYFVHDGGSRVRALALARKTEVLARVIDVDPGIESYKLGRDLNTERAEQTPFDDAISWKRYLESGEFQSQKDLAEAFGKDEATIANVLKLNILPQALMQVMVGAPGCFSQRMSYEVARFHEVTGSSEDDTRKLIEQIKLGDMTTRHVQEYRSRFCAEKGITVSNARGGRPRSTVRAANGAHTAAAGAAATATGREIRFEHRDGTAKGRLVLRGETGFSLELDGLPSSLREKLVHDIDQLLEKAKS